MKIISLMITAVSLLLASQASAEPVKWKLATSWPSDLPILNRSAEYFAEEVAQMSDDRIEIEIVEPSVHKSGLALFQLVRDGAYQMGYTTSHYYKDIVPAIDFFTATPFGLTAIEHYAWMQSGGGQELMDRIFADHGLVALSMGNTGIQMGGWFRREINSVEDLKGLRMRISGMPATVLKSFGVEIAHLGGGEIPKAFEDGKIDAAEFVGPAIDEALDLKSYADYYYTPWHEPSVDLHLLINRTEFENLSADLQSIIRVAAQAAIMRSLTEAVIQNASAWENMQAGDLFEVKQMPPIVIEALRKRTEETFFEIAEADPLAGEVIASLLAFKSKISSYSAVSAGAYQKLQ